MTTQSPRALLAIICAFTASSALFTSTPLIAQSVVGSDSAYAPVSPDVFGTEAVGAGVTFYDARFRRVSLADRNDPAVLAIADRLRGRSSLEQLAIVQREVLARVKWATDLDTMKVADLWANAGETLERGAGDSEDIAIVQMQALRAAGFNPRDLYISIGRQKSVGAHIVLLARTAEGFMVLDDRVGRPMLAQRHHQFTPMLTIGEGKSWVHGRRVAALSVRTSAR
jgi:predicted transglutaminase-like cysteine proteinase